MIIKGTRVALWNNGSPLTDKQGVVVVVETHDGEREYRVKFDNGEIHWLLDEDLVKLPNQPVDKFIVYNNGMGFLPPTAPKIPMSPREKHQLAVERESKDLKLVGMEKPTRQSKRTLIGNPTKGSKLHTSPQERALQRALACGEPLLNARPPLKHATELDSNRPKGPQWWQLSGVKGKPLTKRAKRKLKAFKNRSK